jgi:outer membrane protein TolC
LQIADCRLGSLPWARNVRPGALAGLCLLVFTLSLAHLAAGCATSSPRGLEEAGKRVVARFEEQKAAAPAEAPAKPAPPATRFAHLPKRAPVAAEAAPAPPEAGPSPKPAPRLAGFVDPLTKTSQRIPITLEGCLRRALANNLGIQIAAFGPAIAQTVVRESEAIFDPSWFLNDALSRVKQQSGSFFTGAGTFIAKQSNFSTGLGTLLPTGANVRFGQDWTYQHSNQSFLLSPNPQFDADLSLTVRQPVLRGGGVEVNRSPIVLAQLEETISLAQFKVQLMGILLDVETAYWNLVAADVRIQAVSEALDAARENLRIAARRFEEGKEKRVIVSLASSAVTSRQADLVAARLQLVQTSDLLKRLLHDPELPLKEPTVLEAVELPVTAPIPVGREVLQASMVAAMQHRPEVRQTDARLSQADVRERVADNGRLPQLDLAAGYTLNGLKQKLDRAIDEEFTTNFFDWSVGMQFSVPIGNRARASAYERSQLERSRALHERENTQQQILLEVSDAVRTLAAAEESVLATRAARQAAEQTLHDEQAFVEAGVALAKDLLDAQRDLADAKVREIQAMVSYMVGLAALERAKGTLLSYNNIEVIGAEKAPPGRTGSP